MPLTQNIQNSQTHRDQKKKKKISGCQGLGVAEEYGMNANEYWFLSGIKKKMFQI